MSFLHKVQVLGFISYPGVLAWELSIKDRSNDERLYLHLCDSIFEIVFCRSIFTQQLPRGSFSFSCQGLCWGWGIGTVGFFIPTRLQLVGLRLEAIGWDTCLDKGVFLVSLCKTAGVVWVHHSPSENSPIDSMHHMLEVFFHCSCRCGLSHTWYMPRRGAGYVPLDQMFCQHTAKLQAFLSLAQVPLLHQFHLPQPLTSRYQIWHHLEICIWLTVLEIVLADVIREGLIFLTDKKSGGWQGRAVLWCMTFPGSGGTSYFSCFFLLNAS